MARVQGYPMSHSTTDAQQGKATNERDDGGDWARAKGRFDWTAPSLRRF